MTTNIGDGPWSSPWDCYFSGVKIVDIVGYHDENIKHTLLENCYLNLEDRCLYIPYSLSYNTKIFAYERAKSGTPFHVEDENGNKYTLVGPKDFENKPRGFIGYFKEVIVGDYLNHKIESFYTKKYQCKMDFGLDKELLDLMEETEIIYKDITISLHSEKEENDLVMVVVDMSSTSEEPLEKYMNYVIEILYLVIGEMPRSTIVTSKVGDKEYTAYREAKEKYKHYKPMPDAPILQKINSSTLTDEIFSKFVKYRKKNTILYDIFIDAANSDTYIELACTRLIQSLEGAIRYNHPRKFGDKGMDLRVLLESIYKDGNKYMKMVFKCKDPLERHDFEDRIAKFRNYNSHYGGYDTKTFNTDELIIMRLKTTLLVRTIFFKRLSMKIDKTLYNKIISTYSNLEAERNVDFFPQTTKTKKSKIK